MLYPHIDDEADADAEAKATTMAGGGFSEGAEDERARGWGEWPSNGPLVGSSTIEIRPPTVNGELRPRSVAVSEMISANPAEKAAPLEWQPKNGQGATLVDPVLAIDGTFTPIPNGKWGEQHFAPVPYVPPSVSRIKAGAIFGQTGSAWPTPMSGTGETNARGDDWAGASPWNAMGEPPVTAAQERAKPAVGWGDVGAETIVVTDAERKEAERARAAAEQSDELQVIIRKDGREVKGFELGPLEPVTPRSEKLPPLEAADKMEEVFYHPWRLLPFVGSGEELVEIGKLGLAAYRLSEADKNGSEADPEDLKLVRDYVAQQNRETSLGYEITSVVAALPAFAMELGLTGGIYTAGEKVALKAGKVALEKFGTKAGGELLERIAARTAAKKAGREVADVLGKTAKEKAAEFALRGALATSGAAAQTVPAAGLRVASETIQRMMPVFQFSEDEREKLSAVVTREGDDFGPAMLKAFGNQFAEVLSERTSGALAFMPGAEKLRLLKTQIMRRWFGAHPGATPSQFAKLVHATGWHDVLGEVFEERVGDAMKAGMGLQSWSEVIPTPERMLVEAVSFTAAGPVRGVWRSAVKQAHGFSSSRGAPTGRSAVAGATLAMPETQKRNTGAARQVQVALATGPATEVTSGAGVTTSAAETSASLAETETHAAGAGGRVPSEAPQLSEQPSVVGPRPAGTSSSATEPATLPAEGAGVRENGEYREKSSGYNDDGAELATRERELAELPAEAAPFHRDLLKQRVRALRQTVDQAGGARGHLSAPRSTATSTSAQASQTNFNAGTPSPQPARPFGEVDPATDLHATIETANGKTGTIVAVQDQVVKFRRSDGSLDAVHIDRARVVAPAQESLFSQPQTSHTRNSHEQARGEQTGTDFGRGSRSDDGNLQFSGSGYASEVEGQSARASSGPVAEITGHAGEPEDAGGNFAPDARSLDALRRFYEVPEGVQAHLNRLGIIQLEVAFEEAEGGMAMTERGELLWSELGMLIRQGLVAPQYRRESELALAMEEMIHRAQYLEQTGIEARAGVIWKKMIDGKSRVPALAAAAYGSSHWGELGVEYVRMLVQVRNGYPLSEEFFKDVKELRAALMEPQAPAVEDLIAKVGETLHTGTAAPHPLARSSEPGSTYFASKPSRSRSLRRQVDPAAALHATIETANGKIGTVVAVQGPVVKFLRPDGVTDAAHRQNVRAVAADHTIDLNSNTTYDNTDERSAARVQGRSLEGLVPQSRNEDAGRSSGNAEARYAGLRADDGGPRRSDGSRPSVHQGFAAAERSAIEISPEVAKPRSGENREADVSRDIGEKDAGQGKQVPDARRLAAAREFAGTYELIRKHMQRLGARLVPVVPKITGGGMRTLADGRILLNTEQFEEATSHVDPRLRLDFQISAYIEELAHHSHNLVFPRNRKSSESLFTRLAIGLRGLVKTANGSGYSAADEAAGLGGEALRMFVQVRCGFPLTESFKKDTSDLEAALMERQSLPVEEAITRVSRMLLRGGGRELRAWGESDSYGLGGVSEQGLPKAGSGGASRATHFNAGTPSEANTTGQRPQRAADEPPEVIEASNQAPTASPAPSPVVASRERGDVRPQDIGQTVEDHRGRYGTVVQVSKGAVMARMADGRMIGIERGQARIIPPGEKTGARRRFHGVEAANLQLPKRGGARRSAFTARQMGMLVARIYAQNRSLYEAMGVGQPEVDVDLEGALAMENGHLVINPARLAEQSASLARGGYSTEKWVREAMREEWLHAAQMEAESRAGRNWEKTYAAIWNDAELDTALRAGAARSYAGFDQLNDAQKGAEVMRMVLAARWTGTITERVYRAVQAFVDYLRSLDVAA